MSTVVQMWTRARKAYRCCSCSRRIAKGAKYYRVAAKTLFGSERAPQCERCFESLSRQGAGDGS